MSGDRDNFEDRGVDGRIIETGFKQYGWLGVNCIYLTQHRVVLKLDAEKMVYIKCE